MHFTLACNCKNINRHDPISLRKAFFLNFRIFRIKHVNNDTVSHGMQVTHIRGTCPAYTTLHMGLSVIGSQLVQLGAKAGKGVQHQPGVGYTSSPCPMCTSCGVTKPVGPLTPVVGRRGLEWQLVRLRGTKTPEALGLGVVTLHKKK